MTDELEEINGIEPQLAANGDVEQEVAPKSGFITAILKLSYVRIMEYLKPVGFLLIYFRRPCTWLTEKRPKCG